MENKAYDEHGVHVVEYLLPLGYQVIDAYNPCATVTPWDYHGMCHHREYSKVLATAGIESVLMRTTRVSLFPQGTGPGGAVRFGDNMLPSSYFIAVRDADVAAAHVAIANHRAEVDEWLKNPTRPIPVACCN
jgi:hypothetical protein